MTEKKLNMVHMQLTRNCNLRCWFCGQWGQKGFFSNSSGSDMSLEDWQAVIKSLINYREKKGAAPNIMLWGGEPLLSEYFERIVYTLKENGFKVGIVTNGTLLNRYKICSNLDRIYVSIDGDRKIHDSIRGKGVFDKVVANLSALDGVKITIMTVITKELLGIIDSLPEVYSAINADEVLLQQMIALTPSEVKSYKEWMKSAFNIEARYIDSWLSDYEAVRLKRCPRGFTYLPHVNEGICRSPFKHIHIAWNGEAMYCTDFYDFSAGNVKNTDLIELFNNELSEKFRREIEDNKCSACNHCSWRCNKEFMIE